MAHTTGRPTKPVQRKAAERRAKYRTLRRMARRMTSPEDVALFLDAWVEPAQSMIKREIQPYLKPHLRFEKNTA